MTEERKKAEGMGLKGKKSFFLDPHLPKAKKNLEHPSTGDGEERRKGRKRSKKGPKGAWNLLKSWSWKEIRWLSHSLLREKKGESCYVYYCTIYLCTVQLGTHAEKRNPNISDASFERAINLLSCTSSTRFDFTFPVCNGMFMPTVTWLNCTVNTFSHIRAFFSRIPPHQPDL